MLPIFRFCALVLLAAGGLTSAVAQQPDPPAARPAETGTEGPIGQSVPDVYLQDKDGALILIPDFSLEEFDRLIQISRNLQGPERPWVTLDRLEIRGTASADAVELSIQLSLTRRPSERIAVDTWVPIPIRFAGLVLRGPAVFRGEGHHFLTIGDGEQGYTVWLQAAADTSHQLTLTGVIPISSAGDLRQLKIEAPAVPESSLALEIPFPDAEGEIRSDVVEASRPLESRHADGTTELSAIGIRGDCVVSWHRRAVATAASPARLDVSGTVRVTVEAPQVVNSEARLRVRSFGGPIETFQVRLPPRMVLQEFKSPTYLVTLLDNDLAEGQLIEVRMLRPDVREANLRLLAESPLPMAPADPADATNRLVFFQPARFDVLGSVRQRGTIDIVIQGDWTPSWVEGEYVYRMDQPSDEDESVAARFHYFHQPCNLKVAVRARSTRINVEPTYRITVSPSLVSLDAAFRYRLSGGNAGPLAIDFTGWTVTELMFNDEPPAEPVDRTKVSPMEIPLPATFTRTTDFVLRVAAHRQVSPEVAGSAAPLEFVLPRPDATAPRANLVVNPAEITIAAAENVELTPRLRDLQGMVPHAASGPADVPRRLKPDQHYRDRGLVERARYSADFKLLPRAVSVRLKAAADLAAGATSMRQVLSYSVANVAANQLDLMVPASLVDGEIVNLQAVVNGIGRPMAPVASPGAEADPERTRVSISLGEPLIGEFDVELTYSVAAPSFESDRPTDLTIAIARPVAGPASGTTVAQNALVVTYPDDLAVELVDDAWTLSDDRSGRSLAMATSAAIDEVTLSVTRLPRRASPSTVVTRAWIQTWFLGGTRRDRVAFRVETSERRVRIHLPAGTRRAPLVAVDGHQLIEPSFAGELTIELGADESKTDYVIELWYSVDGPRSAMGHLDLEAPSVVGAQPSHRRYWHLILPEREHLVWYSPSVTPELSWQWKTAAWDRQSLLSQREVEQWVGASAQQEPPEAANDYLFSTFAAGPRLLVVTATRSALVLCASGIVLVVGLIAIYFPVVRHPASLLVAGVLAAAIVLVSPPLAAVLAQAAAVGAALVVFGRSLQWLVSRRRVYRPVVVPASRTAESLTVPSLAGGDASSKTTTVSAPAGMHLPTTDSKS